MGGKVFYSTSKRPVPGKNETDFLLLGLTVRLMCVCKRELLFAVSSVSVQKGIVTCSVISKCVNWNHFLQCHQ